MDLIKLAKDGKYTVNLVNCVGVMGAGLALQYKNAFPDHFTKYKYACDNKLLKPGVVIYDKDNKIFMFPSKDD